MSAVFDLKVAEEILKYEIIKVAHKYREDVWQSALLKAYQHMKKYPDSVRDFGAFFRTVVRSVIAGHYRWRNSRSEAANVFVHFSDYADSQSGEYGSKNFPIAQYHNFGDTLSGYSPEEELINVRLTFEMNASKFTSQERLVIEYLLYADEGTGMNMADISKKLGLNRCYASRALKKLRKICA